MKQDLPPGPPPPSPLHGPPSGCPELIDAGTRWSAMASHPAAPLPPAEPRGGRGSAPEPAGTRVRAPGRTARGPGWAERDERGGRSSMKQHKIHVSKRGGRMGDWRGGSLYFYVQALFSKRLRPCTDISHGCSFQSKHAI